MQEKIINLLKSYFIDLNEFEILSISNPKESIREYPFLGRRMVIFVKYKFNGADKEVETKRLQPNLSAEIVARSIAYKIKNEENILPTDSRISKLYKKL